MTVQELIDRLQKIHDKTQDVACSPSVEDIDSVDGQAFPANGLFESLKWGTVFLLAENTP